MIFFFYYIISYYISLKNNIIYKNPFRNHYFNSILSYSILFYFIIKSLTFVLV